jgi:hypothetical protein
MHFLSSPCVLHDPLISSSSLINCPHNTEWRVQIIKLCSLCSLLQPPVMSSPPLFQLPYLLVNNTPLFLN